MGTICVRLTDAWVGLHNLCNKALEITTHEEYNTGTVYESKNNTVFVPVGVVGQVGSDLKDDHDAVRAAAAVRRETPTGVVVFNDNGWFATNRAELWAAVNDLDVVDEYEPLLWRAGMPDEAARVRIPATVAAEGTAAMAAFLACYRFSNSDIGDALGLAHGQYRSTSATFDRVRDDILRVENARVAGTCG